MARPERRDADYFPFYVKDGKTLFILESKYGLQGIGFFTNVMRFLTKQPNHHICIWDESDRLYFFAQIRCAEDVGMDMLNLMAKTGKIDAGLWAEHRVIVSQDLLNSLREAYKNRNNPIIEMDQVRVSYQDNAISSPHNPISSPHNPQRKGKETKGKEIVDIIIPSWIKQETWDDFCQMRKQKKEPMTNMAATRIIKKLDDLRKTGQDPNVILDESIANGWKGVFPLKMGAINERGTRDSSRGPGLQTTPPEYKPEAPISEEQRKANLERVRSLAGIIAG